MPHNYLRREMGVTARIYAKQFTWDAVAETYESYLLKTISKQAG